MAFQGSLHEEYGIFPGLPYIWDSDDSIPQTPEHEELSSHEADSNSDENLMYEASGCPTIRRLQRVAIHHKHRANTLQLDLVRERGLVASLELQSQEQVERISALSTHTVSLAIERDEARKLARKWKLRACLLGVILLISVLVA